MALEDRRPGRERVLFVDDSPEILSFFVSRLARDDIDAVVCADPRSALRELEGASFVAVLADVYFGLQTAGWDLVTAIRRSKGGTDLPIVSMSGALEDELNSSLQYGADAVLSKPFSYDELRQAIGRAARAHPTRD